MELNFELPKMEYVNDEKSIERRRKLSGNGGKWLWVGEKRSHLPEKYLKQCPFYFNFEVKLDDIWVVTFPRSGTTWTQEMVWLLGIELDFTTAQTLPLIDRFPTLEMSMNMTEEYIQTVLGKNQDNAEIVSLLSKWDLTHETLRSMTSPRFIKTHFLLSLVPNILKSNCKTVYVARNPKDVAVSYYHFYHNLKAYDSQVDFETFWDSFQNNQVCWDPYWEHVKEGWAQRHNPNFLFLFYEEMTHDLTATAKKVAKFLGKSYSEEEYKKLTDHLQFNNFRNNETVNASKGIMNVLFKKDAFVRQGKSQAWHNMFTPELNLKANRWIEDNLRNTDLRFPFIDIYS